MKHRPDDTTPVQDIRALLGLLSKDGDSGLFVTSGRFSTEAVAAARGAGHHVELIDLECFVDLWTQFFSKMTEDDQALLPIVPVFFLARAS